MTSWAVKPLKSGKGRFGFKLTAPYTEERRKAAGEVAKRHTKSKGNDNENPVV